MITWDFTGRRAVVVGCVSGMGEATARVLSAAGAEVHAFDVRPTAVPVASFQAVDLRDPRSIDAAVASLPGEIDLLFNCAGLPQTFPALDVIKVNIVGMRHWTEAWLPRMRRGGAIASISSTGGFAYLRRVPTLLDFLTTPDFDGALAWAQAHPEEVGDGYAFSKEAMIVWTMRMGVRTIARGVRINCICPGPTETPMISAFDDLAGAKVVDVFTQPINRRSSAQEQAQPLIFLNSDAASFINGHALNVDGGFVGGVTAGEIDIQTSVARAMAH